MTAPLRLIKNPRIVAKLAKVWPNNLPAPVFASDTRNLEIAVSVLCNLATRDGERVHCYDLTSSQAADIAKWSRAAALL